MTRPIWLFSQDSEGFSAAPTTTGGLKAYYHRYGKRADRTDINIVHFPDRDEIEGWKQQWLARELPRAQQALADGEQPVVGFSFYTWNAAEFLDLVRFVKQSCAQLLVIAGGPHVQQAEDYLFEDPIDVIVLGEGEQTFTELLDATGREQWPGIDGLAYLDEAGSLTKTTARERITELDTIPSALEVIALAGADGQPLYPSIAYETSRGCPYKCAFCEWGTGAIGSKMHQFSLPRIERDWRLIIAAGIKDIWLADSNFGALREDFAKAELICELKQATGLPSTFATSWSKKHNERVQGIALMLHENGLLPHYQLALQTLTPLALELSHRKNMDANRYQPIAKQMAEAGVPIAAELIWALPGDNLPEFEANLDTLLAIFPNINIFGYTLLPGTEFYEKRDLYQIKTVPVAGYGKAKGEYVVGCHTFDEAEGREGYFLITAHIVLIHGCIMPLVTRFLALQGEIPVSPLLRSVLRALVNAFIDPNSEAQFDPNDPLAVYEHRAALFVRTLRDIESGYRVVREALCDWLRQHHASASLIEQCLAILAIDQAFCPRSGPAVEQVHYFSCDALRIRHRLEAMELPQAMDFAQADKPVCLRHPGGVGDILRDPDGAGWMKSVVVDSGDPSPDVIDPSLTIVNAIA